MLTQHSSKLEQHDKELELKERERWQAEIQVAGLKEEGTAHRIDRVRSLTRISGVEAASKALQKQHTIDRARSLARLQQLRQLARLSKSNVTLTRWRKRD